MDIAISLVALTAMEIVLGIDNIVFIAILAGRLPKEQQAKARTIGLGVALGTRILLLLAIQWILKSTHPIFYLSDFLPQGLLDLFVDELPPVMVESPPAADGAKAAEPHGWAAINGVSVRDLILLGGGLFLIGKSVLEIHHKVEGHESHRQAKAASFASVIAQIAVLDIVFSLDSVITAIGMVPPERIWVMIVAIVIAVGVMLVFSGKVSRFIERHPTLKILALSFLILIGVLLVAEGIGTHMNKGYIYFAMAFSIVVEMLNIKMRGKIIPSVARETIRDDAH